MWYSCIVLNISHISWYNHLSSNTCSKCLLNCVWPIYQLIWQRNSIQHLTCLRRFINMLSRVASDWSFMAFFYDTTNFHLKARIILITFQCTINFHFFHMEKPTTNFDTDISLSSYRHVISLPPQHTSSQLPWKQTYR